MTYTWLEYSDGLGHIVGAIQYLARSRRLDMEPATRTVLDQAYGEVANEMDAAVAHDMAAQYIGYARYRTRSILKDVQWKQPGHLIVCDEPHAFERERRAIVEHAEAQLTLMRRDRECPEACTAAEHKDTSEYGYAGDGTPSNLQMFRRLGHSEPHAPLIEHTADQSYSAADRVRQAFRDHDD